jgi:hypothetical protein
VVARDQHEEGMVPVPAPVAGPTVVRRQLGRHLKALREATGASVNEVASHLQLGISRAKLFKLEAGKHPVKPQDVAVLCGHYGATQEETETLTSLALATTGASWWHVYGEDAVLDGFALYLEIEPITDELSTYESELIPGLLQTPDYARAVYLARSPGDAPEEIERRVALRVQRQAILTRVKPTPPPTLHVVLNEAAVLRQVGGTDVMRHQIDRLRDAARRPNIDINILPLAEGAHAAMESAFVILDFSDPQEDPSVVYLDTPSSAAYLQKPHDVDRYRTIFAHVLKQSVPILEYQP